MVGRIGHDIVVCAVVIHTGSAGQHSFYGLLLPSKTTGGVKQCEQLVIIRIIFAPFALLGGCGDLGLAVSVYLIEFKCDVNYFAFKEDTENGRGCAVIRIGHDRACHGAAVCRFFLIIVILEPGNGACKLRVIHGEALTAADSYFGTDIAEVGKSLA